MSKPSKQSKTMISADEIAPVPQTETAKPETERVDGKTYKELMAELKTKSAVIRFCASHGMKPGPISKFMNIRPQHAYNVLKRPLATDGE